ncbi:MAG: hypothetical protein IPJ32_10320 [Sphingobacteriaceae bacterium]|nr:hypothetical protein [Sphingobacteriaceae bacterium]
MLFSDIPTINNSGELLKSGGEFWINATSNNAALKVRSAAPITIKQPLNGLLQDTAMRPFILGLDANLAPQWNINNNSVANPFFTTSLSSSPNQYIFTLYGNLTSSLSAGTWCNSDNPNYFKAFTQSTITAHSTTSLTGYQTDVFLIFKNNISCMIHVYKASPTNIDDFPYKYAPIGLQCTMVAVAVKNGNVYSSFVPITISAGQTVNFTLSQTTTDDFKAAVNALN